MFGWSLLTHPDFDTHNIISQLKNQGRKSKFDICRIKIHFIGLRVCGCDDPMNVL